MAKRICECESCRHISSKESTIAIFVVVLPLLVIAMMIWNEIAR